MPKREKPSRCPLNPNHGTKLKHFLDRHYYLWLGHGKKVRCKWCGREKRTPTFSREWKLIKSRELWEPLPTHLYGLDSVSVQEP